MKFKSLKLRLNWDFLRSMIAYFFTIMVVVPVLIFVSFDSPDISETIPMLLVLTLLLLVLLFYYLSVDVEGEVVTVGLGKVLSGLLSTWLPAGASFSITCGSWFENVISDEGSVLMFCIVGPLIAIPVLPLLGWVAKKIGLGFITRWNVWWW